MPPPHLPLEQSPEVEHGNARHLVKFLERSRKFWRRSMKNNLLARACSSFIVLLLFLALLGVPNGAARSNARGRHVFSKETGVATVTGGSGMEQQQYPTGSSLPDCSHACGPCVPCKRVMVSYKCATESCPMVYRCMCKGKYYHVPSH